MTIREALSKAKINLKQGGVLEPEASAEVLLSHVLSSSRRLKVNNKADASYLYANLERNLLEKEQKLYKKNIERRLNHEPVWQIIGEVEFWGLPFKVTKDVLVPRPETEFLVQEALKRIKDYELRVINGNKEFSILDIGTGSGAIAIAIAHELTHKPEPITHKLVASDISEKALKIARQNAKLNNVDDQITFIQADLFEPIAKSSKLTAGKFDIVISNLPYIPHKEIETLALDVYHYEPRIALDGGEKGLEIYGRFLSDLSKHLEPGGVAICEIGAHQGENFCRIAEKWSKDFRCEVQKDLAGFDRIAIIEHVNIK